MDDPPRPSLSSPTIGYDSEESRGPLPPPSTASQVPPFDVPAFKIYLAQLLPLVIGADAQELEALFESGEFVERSTRWATDPNAGALYLVKSREEDEETRDTGELTLDYVRNTSS
jgi:dynein heavy chain 1